ncbi:secretion pathway protein [Richelia sinica FACHB-800]|uniref:Secretion pathway protein n=1 Tax=Richelia sinica FACHB-800 TaxID=1357546 RepID=A0A975Y3J9_9NOST|nr:type IV pilin-like G/H family protein [Richelia sinica]MBD2664390.1 type IV pilin-like G/H family protein [Richelia sinica FACHB-800]QXE22213.1 secretion pathway protein [Richelia sinica FACHB-800]
MKTDLKVKFLQHILNKKNNEEGFTLIELLVVIIIIGILSAIALPSFLNQANKAKQSEAKTYIGSMNRAQQAYYAENNVFADNDSFAKLGLGINTQTQNYQYKIANGGSGQTTVSNRAQPKESSAPIKAYVGGVGIGTLGDSSEATTVAILCEANQPININNALNGETDATFTGGTTPPECPTDYSLVK